jgi:SAM-dependent methyltransferase
MLLGGWGRLGPGRGRARLRDSLYRSPDRTRTGGTLVPPSARWRMMRMAGRRPSGRRVPSTVGPAKPHGGRFTSGKRLRDSRHEGKRTHDSEEDAMEGFDPRTSFGYETSMRYDAVDTRGDEEETVAFLARLAGGRDALEFAVGTGRIALPLMRAGVRVDGIELSQDMVDRMREKAGGDAVEVTMGDMSRVSTGRTYGLVYLVYNTIGNLITQDGQVACFENAARHLADGGVFVLECRVPSAPGRPGHQFVDAQHVEVDRVALDVCRYDPVTQILDENTVHISAEGIVLNPVRLRLAHPPEFDLMARIAGLRLRERWAGWNGEPYDARSWRHVSVYERAADR